MDLDKVIEVAADGDCDLFFSPPDAPYHRCVGELSPKLTTPGAQVTVVDASKTAKTEQLTPPAILEGEADAEPVDVLVSSSSSTPSVPPLEQDVSALQSNTSISDGDGEKTEPTSLAVPLPARVIAAPSNANQRRSLSVTSQSSTCHDAAMSDRTSSPSRPPSASSVRRIVVVQPRTAPTRPLPPPPTESIEVPEVEEESAC